MFHTKLRRFCGFLLSHCKDANFVGWLPQHYISSSLYHRHSCQRGKELARSMMRSLSLLLLVALIVLGGSTEGSEHHKQAKREILSRSKRRWVLSTIELEEEMDVKYPYKISTMHNLKTADTEYEFEIKGDGVKEGLFSINKTTGEVYVHRRLDREQKKSYHITFDILDKITKQKIDRDLSFDVDVRDINDNAPRFAAFQKSYDVKENTKEGEYLPVIMDIVDDDEPGTINSSVVVTVGKQSPPEPKIAVKSINGKLHQLISEGCFDYDKEKHFSIVINASDRGKPPVSRTEVIELNIIDTNSHPPTFKKRQYEAEAVEMQTPDDILRVAVEDKDTPNTDGWRAKYSFISGNEDKIYKITTDPKTNEGIIGVVKAKNFDVTTLVKLQIRVENIEPLKVCKDGKLIEDSSILPAKDSVNVTVKMVDTNDAPVFEKFTAEVYQTEESEKGQVLYTPKVKDVDSSNVRFELLEDPAKWVTIDEKTGAITTIEKMDRESPFVDENNIYRIVIAAIDDGSPPATSTCTVSVHLRDINDNTPMLLNKTFILCSNHADKVMVRAKDADAEPFSGPFSFSLADGEEVGIVLLKKSDYGKYSVPIRIQDKQSQAKEEKLAIEVCECDETGVCPKILSIGLGDAVIGIICAGLLAFLLLLLLLKCNQQKHTNPICSEEYTQTLMKYNEEGPGTDCNSKSNILPSMTMESNVNGIKLGHTQMYSNMNLTESQQFVHVQRSKKEDYMMNVNMDILESQRLRGLHKGMTRNARRSTVSSDMRSTVQSFPVSRSKSTWSDNRTSSVLQRSLSVTCDNQTNSSDDYVKIYDYEGNGNSCMSLDLLSSGNQQDDLSFLNDLGPQFKTLEKIIMANKSGVS
ncbi:cadherin-like protein 26 isoform X2 [Xiphophorus couchianus]|uniref:cadherin-like protein 26 isoform X2 n=1 Tax=Xiphophorus couchianus TaxID=32473 RepID=UPI001015CE4C|nr:cadherin-like protein 26 isoform X2 [Xiphophorus couchianus]